jgi:inhibitor of KinA sporulation pathway (predicted exonuclease)
MASSILADLTETVKLYRREAEVHRKQLVSFERFFEALTRLLRKQAPEFLPTMATLGQSFRAGLEHEKLLVEAESRLAEDVNDVAAQYEIVYRVTKESIDARKKVKDSRSKIASLRTALAADDAKGGQKKVKIESQTIYFERI